jgi:hypothetical protein
VGLVALTLLILRFSAIRASEAIVIPVELKGGNNISTVRIDDVDLKTGIDTGGWHDIGIAPEAVAKLRVRFTGTFTEATDGGGNKFRLREFRIPALQLGGVTFRNILGDERRQAANGSPPFDAYIGRGLLERYTVVVDYPHQRFELYPCLRFTTVMPRGAQPHR